MRRYYSVAILLALISGVFRRAGVVKFSKDYVQRAIFQEDFQMVGFLGVVAMVGMVNFVVFLPFVLHAWITLGQITLDPSGVQPFLRPIINLAPLKMIMLKGPSIQQRIALKADIEVLIGFYLVVGWFFGLSHFVSILFYWQVMRLHYMLSYNCQHAFSRFDKKLQVAVFDRPYCPGVLRSAYNTVKSMMVQMGSIPD